ncbi:uncharacterized protein LOC111120013 [Crassostrea virginica]
MENTDEPKDSSGNCPRTANCSESKRTEHFIQIDFGESSEFEIRDTKSSLSSKTKSNSYQQKPEVKYPKSLSQAREDDNKNCEVFGENFNISEAGDEKESLHENHRMERNSFTQLQKTINSSKEVPETSNKKRTINMIVSDILKNKETVEKDNTEDVSNKDAFASDIRKECQPKKRRKASNPMNIAYNEDSQELEENPLLGEEGDFKCEICDEHFSREVDLAEHYMNHKEEDGYSYVYNGKAFETTPEQQSFIESYFYSKIQERTSIQNDRSVAFYPNIPESQDPDDYSDPSTTEEGLELVKAESENPLQCDYCDKAFSSTLLLKRHISVHTGERPHKCEVCGKTFNLPHHLKTHARIHTNVRPYKCEVCGRAFNESSSLKRHTRIHAEERPYIYVCDICGKTFNEPHNLRTHLRIHSDVKPYTCGVCKKAFIRQQTLKNHMRIHTDERPYKCEVCEKAFKELHHLKIHVRIHTDIRPYKCDICEKTFNERSSLKRHIRIHTGEKPYKCTLCEKAFNHNESLKIHLRHHTGERPFTCEICDKTFTDPKNFKSHQKTHASDVKLYTCDSCDKSFAEEARLWQHMRTHTGNLPFKCMICNKKFNQSSSLKRHLSAVHPGISLTDKRLLSSSPDESDETFDSLDEELNEDNDDENFGGDTGIVHEPTETSSTYHCGAEKV